MRPEREFVMFFGCMPHTPDRAYPELARFARGKGKKSIPATCRTCGGVQPEGSPFVCAGCHGVEPGAEAHLASAQVEAIAAREPEHNMMGRSAREKLEASAPRKPRGSRSIMSFQERAELIAEYPDLAPRWLDSIGQPAPTPEQLAAEKESRKRKNGRPAA